MNELTEQELHNLAMNIVGKDLEKQGFEFMAVNSKLKKDPQFVCLKDKKLHFVVVKAISYPENPEEYDVIYMETMRAHAQKFKARTFYAGVGLANATDLEKPLIKNQDYIVNYNGIIEI
ncbi:Na(+)-translocating NADH-quinone reductase subunit F [Robertkochia solimangrovi]|uniref:Na(+)-translocating NADH-quinone reductase subunit F n=1 Tax=Robertkochia solimangrovi TaxID=2213046 RepID=UPI00117C34C2|nr:Na(+)-translocating NADH-quinone reductase subunit F [Robertkochia solimangrovi]TRZ41402.1 Na(+)-translocating NADH-quinone reductase subunit F [Robertkochia solimangrovi]